MGFIKKMRDCGTFKNVTFSRRDKVKTLATVVSSLKIGNLKIPSIDPLTLFQIMYLSKQEESDIANFLKFEIAPFQWLRSLKQVV